MKSFVYMSKEGSVEDEKRGSSNGLIKISLRCDNGWSGPYFEELIQAYLFTYSAGLTSDHVCQEGEILWR